MSIKEELDGKYFMGNRSNANSDLYLPENQILRMAEKQRQEEEIKEANRIYLEAQKIKQDELNEKLERLELIPLGQKIILLPYPTNPYKKLVNGSILIAYEGEFINPDSGEADKLDRLVACGKVIEIGPECKYLKPGDDIFYDPRTCYPLPFMSLGYKLTTEPQILAIVNESLKERFNME